MSWLSSNGTWGAGELRFAWISGSRLASDCPGEQVASSMRYFALQAICNAKGANVAFEALYRSGWQSTASRSGDSATATMIDNWLLFGMERWTGQCPISLNCTREALLGGRLELLPSGSLLAIPRSVEPDDEVLNACWRLKMLGYGITLDDYQQSSCSDFRAEQLLDYADSVKIHFRSTSHREREQIVNRLQDRGISPIADQIENEPEFVQACMEGFGLFQGDFLAEPKEFTLPCDAVDQSACMDLLELLDQENASPEELMRAIVRNPALEQRLMRRASWYSGDTVPISQLRVALELVQAEELREITLLALECGAEGQPVWGRGRSGLSAGHVCTEEPRADNLPGSC